MMFFDLPMRTKKVPAMEVRMHAPQMASGRVIMVRRVSSPALRKKMAPRTMVATMVTA